MARRTVNSDCTWATTEQITTRGAAKGRVDHMEPQPHRHQAGPKSRQPGNKATQQSPRQHEENEAHGAATFRKPREGCGLAPSPPVGRISGQPDMTASPLASIPRMGPSQPILRGRTSP